MCRKVCLSAFLCRQMFVEVHFYVLGVYVSFCVVLVKLCRNICVFTVILADLMCFLNLTQHSQTNAFLEHIVIRTNLAQIVKFTKVQKMRVERGR